MKNRKIKWIAAVCALGLLTAGCGEKSPAVEAERARLEGPAAEAESTRVEGPAAEAEHVRVEGPAAETGRLQISSTPGEGSTFSLFFPYKAEKRSTHEKNQNNDRRG